MRSSDPITVHDLPKNPPAAPTSIAPAEPTPPPVPAPETPPVKSEPKPEPAPTLKEGREEARKQVMSKLFGIEPEATAPKEDKPVDDTTAAAPPTPEATPAAQKKPRKVAPKPEIDAAAITAAATTAATKAVADAQRTAPAPAARPETSESKPDISVLSVEDQELVPVFEKMEQLNPEKYRGLVGKLVDYERKQDDYAAQWEKDHPGEDYDPGDSAHDEWHAKHKPKWSDRDLRRAENILDTEPLAKKLDNYERSQQDAKEHATRMERVKPDLEIATNAVPKLIAEFIAPEFADVDNLKSDPLALEIVQRATAHVQSDLKELAQIITKGPSYYNDDNPTHKRVLDAAVNLEGEILALAPEARERYGKAFATREQYFQMTPQQQERHWCPEFQDIAGYMARKTAEYAKNVHQNELRRIEQLGYVRNGASKSPPKANGEAAAKPQPEQRMSPSPTHSPGAVAPASTANGQKKAPSWKEAFGLA